MRFLAAASWCIAVATVCSRSVMAARAASHSVWLTTGGRAGAIDEKVASFAPLRHHALSWTLATGALWAIGWAVTTGAGVNVEDQWPLFGISGALVVAAGQSVFINRFVPAPESNREVANTG
jgi:hypothetical protein